MPGFVQWTFFALFQCSLIFVSRAAGSMSNYSFALFWPQSGVSADADSQFSGIFRDRLSAMCLAQGVTLPADFSVRFTDFLLPSVKPSISAMNSFAASLKSEGAKYAFAGTTSSLDASTLRLLESTGDFKLHTVDPPSLSVLAPSLISVVRAIQRPPWLDADVDIEENRMLVVVVGWPYQLSEVQQLLRAYDHGVRCFAIGAPDLVASIERSYITTILVLASRPATVTFVYSGLDGALWSPDYRWILFNSGLIYEMKPNLLSSNSRNITGVEFGPFSRDLEPYLKTTSQVMLYDLLNIWTAYMANMTCGVSIEDQTLTGLTGQFRLWSNGTVARQNWQMTIYRNLLTAGTVVGNISTSGSFNMRKPTPRSSAREDILDEYRKLNLTVYVIPGSQYMRYKKGMETAVHLPLVQRLEGMAFDLCMEIFARLGINNITMVVQPDLNYGVYIEGEWNGVVKSLIQGGADMACVDLTINNQRKRDMDFTAPFLQSNISILYKANKKEANKEMFQFMYPFAYGTWFYLGGALVIVAILLTVLHRISPNLYPFDLKYSMFFSMASLVQGVVGHPPNRPSGRIVVSAYWLFVTLLLVVYVGNYAAMRTLEKMEVTITTVFSLTGQFAYTYGTLANSSTAGSFQSSSFSDMKIAFERMRKFPLGFFNDTQVAIAAVNQGKFAMIYDTPTNLYAQQLGCNLVVTGYYQSVDLALGFPKRSDLRQLVDDELQKLLTKGRVDELYKKYFVVPSAERPNCNPQSIASLIPDEPPALKPESGALTLRNTVGLLVINIIGCCLTLLTAGAEYAYDRLRTREKPDDGPSLDRSRRNTISNILRLNSIRASIQSRLESQF